MVERTNLDYLADVLQTYNIAFHSIVFYEMRIPTVEEAGAFNCAKSLLHWSGVRSVLPFEFNQNRDSLSNDVFERYCKSLVGIADNVREILLPFRGRYDIALINKEIDISHHGELLAPINAYLWAIDDLMERVRYYYPHFILSAEKSSNIETTAPEIENHPISVALEKYGFSTLDKVNIYSDINELVSIIIEAPKNHGLKRKNNKALGYKMAMINFLEFDKHILRNHADNSKERMFAILGEIFDADPRTVKGHLNSLTSKSADRCKYNAHTFVDQVTKDYQNR